jgi:hypothetical protein
MREISMVENPAAFSEVIRPISPSVRGLTILFSRAWAFVVVGRPRRVAEKAELLIGLLRENFWS